MLFKNILSLTLTLGCKNKKRPSGPIEVDLEAGNLVVFTSCKTCRDSMDKEKIEKSTSVQFMILRELMMRRLKDQALVKHNRNLEEG